MVTATVTAMSPVGMFWKGLAPDWVRHQLARNGKAGACLFSDNVDAMLGSQLPGWGEVMNIDWKERLMKKSAGDASVGGKKQPLRMPLARMLFSWWRKSWSEQIVSHPLSISSNIFNNSSSSLDECTETHL